MAVHTVDKLQFFSVRCNIYISRLC